MPEHEGDFEVLARLLASRQVPSLITHIRFPKFKTLAPGARIDFAYPITALVGPNGTNKSSILRALRACPEGYNSRARGSTPLWIQQTLMKRGGEERISIATFTGTSRPLAQWPKF
jgi:predicted ATPase